jgi:hypothetical protein
MFVLKPFSERKVASVRYCMKTDGSRYTPVIDAYIECNVFVKM